MGVAETSRIKAKSNGLIPAPGSPNLLTTAAEPQQSCVTNKA
eukprot:CAMPEP_0183586992 /NCGR_PEP_ID=MMETSP0371-20130417/158161_1 /TAXON_ID=268820 /ORGANISM="Peridinium aciculiferum, Strain PAER-2" /LENGTH=41 /DNA_ID= /DNA_START= /DNA_END= /DNA_ORIENTATION=